MHMNGEATRSLLIRAASLLSCLLRIGCGEQMTSPRVSAPTPFSPLILNPISLSPPRPNSLAFALTLALTLTHTPSPQSVAEMLIAFLYGPYDWWVVWHGTLQ